MSGLFHIIAEKFKKDKSSSKDSLPKEKKEEHKKNLSTLIGENTQGLIKKTQPLVYSMAEENNIACKYNHYIIATRDKNLCIGFKLEGTSYAAKNEEEEIALASARNRFWSRLDDNIEMNIIVKKEKIFLENNSDSINNVHIREIVDKWEKNQTAYKIIYYLIFSTKNKAVANFFQGLKDKATQEQEEKDEAEQAKIAYHLKEKQLNELKIQLLADLSAFKPKVLESDELLNIFASYANGMKTNLKYSYDLITDCYLTSDVEFKKDYMIFNRNDEFKTYARFISIKAYETDYISSIINTSILRENMEYMIFVHCEPLPKEKALKKIKDTKAVSVDFIRDELDNFIDLIRSDREKIILTSYSVLVSATGKVIDGDTKQHKKILEELDEKSDILKGLLENQSLAVCKETLNQKPLFFSFFPSRGNLNARIRSLQGRNLATIINFENDILGYRKNSWGNMPITIFKHLSGSPFLFNFHESEAKNALGHTLVVGGTGSGKTTLMQFLMANLYKYDINILALDKLRGMFNFANYVDGEYHDLDLGEFKLNPFSLEDTDENNNFLVQWLCKMGTINETEHELENIIKNTLRSLRDSHKGEDRIEQIFKFNDFVNSLSIPENTEIEDRFRKFRGSIFDNREDALNFNKKMSIINMDAILKDERLSGLSAMYLFHKISNMSKNSGKGFMIWIDELKDYLLDDTMREKILEAILEVRKINGVVTMGVQNLDFFNDIPKSDSFISQMANYIIYPTTSERTLENMADKLSLTNSEIDFLRVTPKESRQFLFKQNNTQQSAVLNANFAKLGDYIRVFSSNSEDVKWMQEVKQRYPNEWRSRYLTQK